MRIDKQISILTQFGKWNAIFVNVEHIRVYYDQMSAVDGTLQELMLGIGHFTVVSKTSMYIAPNALGELNRFAWDYWSWPRSKNGLGLISISSTGLEIYPKKPYVRVGFLRQKWECWTLIFFPNVRNRVNSVSILYLYMKTIHMLRIGRQGSEAIDVIYSFNSLNIYQAGGQRLNF